MREPHPGADHVLIVGPRKTATTGLYHSVKTALHEAGVPARTLFEPKSRDRIANLFRLAPGTPVMAKVTLQSFDRMGIDARAFDRRLMTVRDPRDTAISALLFHPLLAGVARRTDEATVRTFVDALRRKEADPGSVSVRELMRLATDLGLGRDSPRTIWRVLRRQQRLLDRGGFVAVRYERFVRGELDDISSYLGLPLRNLSAERSAVYGHIARTGTSGGFRHWFREDDLAWFDRTLGPAIAALGYPREVELAERQVIDPATSSEHVWNSFRQRRRSLEQRTSDRERMLGGGTVDAQAVYAELVERAGDGDPDACLRAARLALDGSLGGRDEAAGLHWARAAAELGSVPAMRLTADLLAPAGRDDPAVRREALAWRVEHQSRRGGGVRVAELEAEVATLRASAGYRLGRALVDAAQDPRRRARQALRDVAAVYRSRHRT